MSRILSRILGIDPGPAKSALVGLVGAAIVERVHASNPEIVDAIRKLSHAFDLLAIEWIESFGMPVGAEVFHTCRWVGRFEAAWDRPHEIRLVPRRHVKLALCNSTRAKDANVRRALLDRYGGDESVRKGGPLAGVRRDLWSALAVGVTAQAGIVAGTDCVGT